MKDNRRTAGALPPSLSAAGLLLALVAGGCVSPQILKDKDNEIATLREERTRLKKELQDKNGELESLEVALAEANVTRDRTPVPDPDYPELDEQGITTYFQPGGNLVISVPAEITFPSGKADLSKQGRDALSVVARTLSQNYPGHDYWIEGHTDTDPISKAKFESNRALSLARAMSVLHYLVEDCGVADDQCVVAGHGEYEPRAANDSGQGKAQNRRVEIVVHKPGT